jgi:hypothetical protein
VLREEEPINLLIKCGRWDNVAWKDVEYKTSMDPRVRLNYMEF